MRYPITSTFRLPPFDFRNFTTDITPKPLISNETKSKIANAHYFKSIVKHNENEQSAEKVTAIPHDSLIEHDKEPSDVLQTDADIEVTKFEIPPVYSLAAFINDSETLRQLLKLGVDMSRVELIEGAANLFVTLDFQRDIQPILFYLKDLGLADSDLGECITRNPMMLGKRCESLQPMVDYLQSKAFNRESLARIVQKVPAILMTDVKDVDNVLGQYQKLFRLQGSEVREVITRLPKLVLWNPTKVKYIRLYINEFLGFSNFEQKQMFLACPKVYLSSQHQLEVRFDIIHNVIGMTHAQIVNWPAALRTRPHILKQRHKYLVHLKRAQYDPTLENYISLRALTMGREIEFCELVAKSNVAHMDAYLKTI